MSILLLVVVEMETDQESVADGILDTMVERLGELGELERKTPIWRRENHLKGTLSFICEADGDESLAQEASSRLATGWTPLEHAPTLESSLVIWNYGGQAKTFHPAIRFICVEARSKWVFADPTRPQQPESDKRRAMKKEIS